MQFFTVAAVLFSAVASAVALESPTERAVALCPAGLYSVPSCCTDERLGLSFRDCKVPSPFPTDQTSFVIGCGKDGRQARCCGRPVSGPDYLCSDPIVAPPCPNETPQCCALDHRFGALKCEAPSKSPTTNDFKALCAARGLGASCCNKAGCNPFVV